MYRSDTFPTNSFLLVNFVSGMELSFKLIENIGLLLRYVIFLLNLIQ